MNECFVVSDVFEVERDPDPKRRRRTEKIIELHRATSIAADSTN
jgi:hypothetical protein